MEEEVEEGIWMSFGECALILKIKSGKTVLREIHLVSTLPTYQPVVLWLLLDCNFSKTTIADGCWKL